MDYNQTLHYLFSQLPMYSRVGAAAYKADLKNTVALCEILNHPEKKLKCIHVAGTNGKGSTSHMLAAILQANGYKTGLYTSPHLKDFRERIRINGEMIPEKYVVDFVATYHDSFLKIQPSFFEWSVALCFKYFEDEAVDIAVIETGLGGRLDSTNVITPFLSVITNISNDHANLLGDTIQKIAMEKAGIVKQNIPVVIGERQTDSENVFVERAKHMNAEIVFASDYYKSNCIETNQTHQTIQVTHKSEVQTFAIDLLGSYQLKNIQTVLCAYNILKEQGIQLDDEKTFSALSSVKKLTALQGRWHVLNQSPFIVADVAHNEAGLKETLKQFLSHPSTHKNFVIGFVNDKSLEKILPLFPKDATYFFCCPDIPRGYPVDELQKLADQFGLNGKSYSSVKQAMTKAIESLSSNSSLYVGGSTFVVAEAI